jgi:choline-sulfatase
MPETAPPPSRPNILLVFSDQQHWQAMGCMDPFFDTPHLDRFAQQSVLFERSFCTTPQCSPSRSTILTGLYPSATGVMGNVGNAGGEPLHMPTIGPEWQAAGYRTGYFGKWHLGDDPTALAGWDESVMKIDDPLAEAGAVRFLENRQGESDPFTLVVSINNPHDIYRFQQHQVKDSNRGVPLPQSWEQETFTGKPAVQRQFMTEDQGQAIEGEPEETWRKYQDCYREKTRLYDAHVGQILDALDRSGRAEETIVIITSDHGDMDAQHRLIFKGPFMYEHLIRVPLMIRVPGSFGPIAAGSRSDVDVVNTDLVPTLRDLCGLPAKNSHGLSLAPLLRQSNTTYTPRKFVFGQYYGKQDWVNPMRMIRTRHWKLICHLQGETELYDLESDPDELHNRASHPDCSAIREELKEQLQVWMEEIKDPFLQFTVTDRHGHPLET